MLWGCGIRLWVRSIIRRRGGGFGVPLARRHGVGADRRAGRAVQHGSRVNYLVDRRTVRRPDRRALCSENDRHPSRIAGAFYIRALTKRCCRQGPLWWQRLRRCNLCDALAAELRVRS